MLNSVVTRVQIFKYKQKLYALLQPRGVCMNYRSVLPYHPAYQIENAMNEGGGSLCYAISGLLCWFQMSLNANEGAAHQHAIQQDIVMVAHSETALSTPGAHHAMTAGQLSSGMVVTIV